MGADAVIYAGLAISALSAAVSGTAAVQQGQTARTQANMNADAAKDTARSIENQAASVAADQKMKSRRIIASQVAAAGAGGVDPGTGSPLDLSAEAAEFGELDSLRIINNAQRTAWGYNTQASITEYGGQQAQNASYLNATGSALGSASNAAFGYKRAK